MVILALFRPKPRKEALLRPPHQLTSILTTGNFFPPLYTLPMSLSQFLLLGFAGMNDSLMKNITSGWRITLISVISFNPISNPIILYVGFLVALFFSSQKMYLRLGTSSGCLEEVWFHLEETLVQTCHKSLKFKNG